MPSHLRIFFWLIVAIAAYWVVTAVWFLEFPPAAVKAVMARLPEAARQMIAQNDWKLVLIPALSWAVLFSGLAWLAACKRQNWARVGVLVLFLIRVLVPLAMAAAAGRVIFYLQLTYRNPAADAETLILALAILFSFTGNARAAFAASE